MVDLTSTLPDLSPEGRTPPLIVHWHIDSEPRGAQVLDASGQVHGITPLSVELPSSPGLTRFSIRLDGYVDSSVSLDGSRDDSPKVFLRRKTTVLKTPTSILPNLIKSKQELGYED